MIDFEYELQTMFVSLDMMFTNWPVEVSPLAVDVKTRALR